MAPFVTVTVDSRFFEDDGGAEITGYEVCARSTNPEAGPETAVVRCCGSSQTLKLGMLLPGVTYGVSWRAVRAGSPGPHNVRYSSWSASTQVHVAGRGRILDLRKLGAEDRIAALALAARTKPHSQRWLWVPGSDLVSPMGRAALQGAYLYGGLARPAVRVLGDNINSDATAVSQHTIIEVLCGEAEAVPTPENEAGSSWGSEVETLDCASGLRALFQGFSGARSRVPVLWHACGQQYQVRGRVWGGGTSAVSLWSVPFRVVSPAYPTLPALQCFPPLQGPRNLLELRWSKAVNLDTVSSVSPCPVALDADRLAVEPGVGTSPGGRGLCAVSG